MRLGEAGLETKVQTERRSRCMGRCWWIAGRPLLLGTGYASESECR